MKKILAYVLVIMGTELPAQNLEPTATETLLNVSVINGKKKPLGGETVTFISLKDGKSLSGTTGNNGRFSVLIPNAQKYKVRYKAYTEQKDYTTLDIPSVANLTFGYTLTIDPPRVFTLDNVFFDTGKSTLRNESAKELYELAEYMMLKKEMVIEIGGHTDNVGTAESNLVLSTERAKAVKQYLQKKGISPERVMAKGYGDTQPVAGNDTPEGRQKNRRTEVRIISEEK